MEQQVIDSVTLGGSVAPHDLSVWGLFLQADLIVKIVIFMLVLASIWCWTIIIDKVIRLRRLRGKANRFEEAFWSGGSLEDLYDRLNERPGDPMASLFVAAMREWRRSVDRGMQGATSRQSLRQRLERVMDISIMRDMEGLERHMIFLASTGSAAPFIGLFGTVWGIMQSFSAIGSYGSADIAVVAPGISAALTTTAAGLAAAIPAVVAYNYLQTRVRGLAGRMEDFGLEFLALIERNFPTKD